MTQRRYSVTVAGQGRPTSRLVAKTPNRSDLARIVDTLHAFGYKVDGVRRLSAGNSKPSSFASPIAVGPRPLDNEPSAVNQTSARRNP